MLLELMDHHVVNAGHWLVLAFCHERSNIAVSLCQMTKPPGGRRSKTCGMTTGKANPQKGMRMMQRQRREYFLARADELDLAASAAPFPAISEGYRERIKPPSATVAK